MLYIPLVALMTGASKQILATAYGNAYSVVFLSFSLLCIYMMVLTQSLFFVSIYLALGMPQFHRLVVGLRAVIVVCMIYPATSLYGMPGAAGVLLLASSVSLVVQIISARERIGLRFRDYAKCWLPGLLTSGIVLVSIALVRVFEV